MSRSLDFFELAFAEELVMQGDDLCADGAVQSIDQIERGLYSIAVLDGTDVHEVEVLKPKLKSRVCTCECLQAKRHKACRHIVAALYSLRRHFDSIEQARVKKKRKRSTKRLDINTVLQEISKDELVSFVQGYARRDKSFSTLLKAHFARQVDAADAKNKYKQILTSVIKPVQTAEVQLKGSQVRLYAHAAGELVDQLEDAMVLKDYVEALEIWKACTQKNEYVYKYSDLQGKAVDELTLRLHHVARELLSSDLAPELKKEVQQALIEVGELSYYVYRSVMLNPIELLYRHAQLTTDDKLALLTVVRRLAQDRLGSAEQPILEALSIRLQLQLGNKPDVEQLLADHYSIVSSIIRAILTANDYDAARWLSEHLRDAGHSTPTITKTLVEIYEHQGARRPLRQLAMEAFLQSHELRYFDLLKANVKVDRWPRVRKEVLSQVDKIAVRTEALRRDLDWAALTDELRAEGDLELTMQYTSYLKVYEPAALADLHVEQIRTYLQGHIGRQSQDYLDTFLLTLEKEGAVTSIKRVIKMLDKEFSYRSRLLSS